MSAFVLDCSVTMAWCFEGAANSYAEAVFGGLGTSRGMVPAIWPLEVANVLLVGERHRKLSPKESTRFLSVLDKLPITVLEDTSRRAFAAILALARDQSLSSYDASYLELAMRESLPLATLDLALRRAASAVGVSLIWVGRG